jgi:hypothetical protein
MLSRLNISRHLQPRHQHQHHRPVVALLPPLVVNERHCQPSMVVMKLSLQVPMVIPPRERKMLLMMNKPFFIVHITIPYS